ncbi:MAG: Maf family protein, partial [Candidatus Thermoplasmatota archaeon]|nr:Maf family protein [Candidatus Thermoplasmatota archaeon]
MKIVLASSSPRRQQLLSPLLPGLEIVHPRLSEDVPDSVQDVENARKIAEGLALHKARDVLGSAGLEEDVVIIGADTIVVCDGKILGKPLSPEEAFEMLFSLSGRGHDVITGVAVVSAKAQYAASCCTRVFFKELDARTIKDYTASTEPFDKAGAYGIQGAGGELVDRIEGSWSNVVGLPLQTLADLLNNFGVV